MPNKWLNPPPREKPTNDVTNHNFGRGISFDTIKEQVGKKPISTNSKKDRVTSKSFGEKKKIKPAKVDDTDINKKQSAWDAEFPHSWEDEKGKLFWQLNSSGKD